MESTARSLPRPPAPQPLPPSQPRRCAAALPPPAAPGHPSFGPKRRAAAPAARAGGGGFRRGPVEPRPFGERRPGPRHRGAGSLRPRTLGRGGGGGWGPPSIRLACRGRDGAVVRERGWGWGGFTAAHTPARFRVGQCRPGLVLAAPPHRSRASRGPPVRGPFAAPPPGGAGCQTAAAAVPVQHWSWPGPGPGWAGPILAGPGRGPSCPARRRGSGRGSGFPACSVCVRE